MYLKTASLPFWRLLKLSLKFAALFLVISGLIPAAQAQTFTPVFSNLWVVAAGAYPDLTNDANNLVRGVAIGGTTTNVLYASRGSGSNHVSVVSFASGSNFVTSLSALTISAGTLALEGVRSADDGSVYACNLSGAPGSRFLIFRWPSEAPDVPPTVVYDSSTFGSSFQWRLGDYMDLRGSGSNTEIVVVGNGSGANITTNFVIFRPTDDTCTTFTNFSITIPGGVNNLCGAGVAFEGTNNAIWIRQAGVQSTRHIVYDPNALTAICDRTNTVDQSVCQGLKYYKANGVGLLATVQAPTGASTQIARVFQVPTSPLGPFVSALNSSLPFVTGSANGNGIGNVDARNGYFVFGAPGHGLGFYTVSWTTNSPPSVTISGSGSPVIQGSSATFTATATGTTPLSYQWYYTNGVSSNIISGAVTNIYSIAAAQPTNTGGYFIVVTNLYGKATSGIVNISVLPNGGSKLFTNVWSLAAGSRPYLTTTDTQRGLAYDHVLNRLVLVTRGPTNGIILLDADTGADAGNLDISALLAITPPGIFPINMCGVADDGIVYVCNLLTSPTSDSFAIYSWTSADPSATIGQAYAANPGVARIGDVMAVRGAGVNTEILCSFRTGTNVALFTTGDGANFNLNVIAITNLPASAQANGFAGLGLAFGPGNTFWAKSSGFDLRQVSYDVSGGTGAVINDYPNIPTPEAVIGVDNDNGYVAIIAPTENPQNLVIYDLLAPGGPSLTNLVDREFFPTSNANANGTGSVAVDVPNGRIFALDSNNGIIAVTYSGRPFIGTVANEFVITWPTTNAVLQSATNAAGPFVDVPGATSPYTNNNGAAAFFRLRK